MTKQFIAVIPARGGSKGLKDKNIFPLCGKPLIYWTIEAAKRSKKISKIVVSTDSDKIKDVAEENGVLVLDRPEALAQDETPAIPVVLHALEELAGCYDEEAAVVLLQPTSPLRTSLHIDSAINQFLKSNTDSLISVCNADNSILKYLIDEGQRVRPLGNDNFTFSRRQDLPRVCKPNGAIYITNIQLLKTERKLLSSQGLAFYMEKEVSLDVDGEDDIQEAAGILLRNIDLSKR